MSDVLDGVGSQSTLKNIFLRCLGYLAECIDFELLATQSQSQSFSGDYLTLMIVCYDNWMSF